MNKRQFSKREKLIFSITVILGLFVFGLNFIVLPALERINVLNREIDQKSFILKRHFKLINQGDSITSVYENYKQILSKVVNPDEMTAQLFEEVKLSAGKYGLKVQKIKPLTLKQNTSYKKVALEVDLEGDFKSIFQFINMIENSASLIDINSLNLRSKARSSKLLRCRLALSRSFF